jgi:hypothetical protein
MMEECGFSNCAVTSVGKTGVIEEASLAAQGFVQGLPVINLIRKKDPSLAVKIQDALEVELKVRLGDRPLQSPLVALVFQGRAGLL